jgi:hypothetical protein
LIRIRIESAPVERADLQKLCAELGIPADQNRENAGERLGFLGRLIHDLNARAWLKELKF